MPWQRGADVFRVLSAPRTVLAEDPPYYDVAEDGLVNYGDFTSQFNGPVQFLGPMIAAGGRPWVDVLAFGGDPTGRSDSTAAINGALASGAGGTVFFPPGTYTVSGALTAQASTLIFGNATIKIASGANLIVSILTIASSCRIDGLTFDGNLSNQTAGGTGSTAFIRATSASNIRVSNCVIQNYWNNGIGVSSCTNVTVSQCRFDNIANGTGLGSGQGNAISCASGTNTAIRILDCIANNIGFGRPGGSVVFGFGTGTVNAMACGNTITGFPFIGIGLGTSGIGALVAGNYVDNLATTTASAGCIDTGTSSDITIAENILYGHGLGGGIINGPPNLNARIINNNLDSCPIFMGGGSTSGAKANFVISGNVVHNAPAYGIVTPNLDGGVISNNVCYNNGQTSPNAWNQSGISIQGSSAGPCHNIVVSNNRCYDNQTTPTQQYGIYIYDSSGTPNLFNNILILNNDVSGNGTAGINYGTGNFYAFNAGCMVKDNAGFNPFGALSGAVKPAVPASGTPSTQTVFDSSVFITAGSSTCAVAIGGTATGITIAAGAVGQFFVPAGQTVTLTYTNAPTWVWIGD